MIPAGAGGLRAWVPRGLVELASGQRPLQPPSADGLVAAEVSWRDGRLESIGPLPEGSSAPERMVLPRLVEPHAHLDKAFTWAQASNRSGTYSGALTANLAEHRSRTEAAVRDRAEPVSYTHLTLPTNREV